MTVVNILSGLNPCFFYLLLIAGLMVSQGQSRGRRSSHSQDEEKNPARIDVFLVPVKALYRIMLHDGREQGKM